MLTRPRDLPEDVLVSTLARRWDLRVTALAYRPFGFGSHHWEVTDEAGGRWFVTVDELETKKLWAGESLDAALDRLRAALAAAADLRALGAEFVVAPVATRDGEPLAWILGRFGVALYPYLHGQSFTWGGFATPAHRRAVLALVIAVHTAPAAARRRARTDDFTIPHRDELEAALDPRAEVADCGPYARPAAALVAGHAPAIRRRLARYDELAALGRAQADRMVLTHGEPHPGNTLLTAEGWRLVDWDTALVAPPERDLWLLDPGDGSTLEAYAAATGVPALPAMLELYRLRWDLADIAVEVSRFRRRHAGTADDDQAWEILRSWIEKAAL